MTDRKNPGVAFWATVVLVVVLVGYPLSFGPACWLGNHRQISAQTIRTVYRPVFAIWGSGPSIARRAISRYFDFCCGSGPRTVTYLELELENLDRK